MTKTPRFGTYAVLALAFSFLSAKAAGGAPDAAIVFQECRDCPAMLELSSGNFELQTPDTKQFADDRFRAPARATVISVKRFAMAIAPVTRAEYAAFVAATHHAGGQGCEGLWDGQRWRKDARATWQAPGFPQSEQDPVVCVSWNDAQAYVAWLNQRLSILRKQPPRAVRPGHYRLPTGAEWEYAARGGSAKDGPYGPSTIVSDYANLGLDQCWPCGGKVEGRDNWLYTSPAGALLANHLGFHDMFGNVWQWTEDCFNAEPYLAQSSDGTQAVTGDCTIRRLRGASWDDSARGASWRGLLLERNERRTAVRNNANGFRIARSLED